jgi:FkbM family methyltransferase
MSNFNTRWLVENLPSNPTIFYVGAANLVDAIEIKKTFPNSIFHAFECSRYWVDKFPIVDNAKEHNINYHQLAVSDTDGQISFYPCEKHDGNDWPVSSSMFKPNEHLSFLEFSDPITVDSITLKTFCETHSLHPDFIHIDVQGAEYKVFSNIGVYKPKIVWAEISEFDRYDTGITYQTFLTLMIELGYNKVFSDGPDELYVLKDSVTTPYVSNTQQNFIESKKKLKFVFKQRNHVSQYDIHGVGKTSFYNLLYQLNLAEEPYYSDNLPSDNFIYEFQQSWLMEPENYFGDQGFLELDPCPENVLERIKNKSAILLITIPYESPIQFNRLIKIHSYLSRHDLPSSQVIYLNCCLNGNEVYKSYCDSIGEEPRCRLEYMAENLIIHANLSEKFKQFNYVPKPVPKTFLMFNRRWLSHPHRTLFLYNIFKRNLLDTFHMSFTKMDVDHQVSYSNTVNNQFRNFYYKEDNQLDYGLLEELENRLPLVLDTDDLVSGSLMFDQLSTTKNFYDTSFIHIISETYFNTDIIHITEKSYKPILYRQPFIMLGPPKILKHMKKLGFKTFEHVWDESYDEVTDHTERFYRILDLVEEFGNYDMPQKINLMKQCVDTIEHNFNVLSSFKSKPKFVFDQIYRLKLW